MSFNPGLAVRVRQYPLGFEFGPGVFGPAPEYRSLEAIRKSLQDPDCCGPDPVYAIAMDVGKQEHCQELKRRMLLFGVVTYAAGRLGKEPVRSQGHIHRVAAHSGWSPPEIYEIWAGRAVVYIQEFAADDPGRCFAVTAEPGEVVVVPPGWAHATLSASLDVPLTFGAWCDRDYGFEYEQVHAHCGLAWFALLNQDGQLEWHRNSAYLPRELNVGVARDYPELGLERNKAIYAKFEENPETVQWVSKPAHFAELWPRFIPCRVERTVRS
ncbi:MAG TPA: glucose-6-phosphate isomerase family protein [Candidatus Limnocylindrales bacterium]|nr:glucose-6-phosphate isomerase family protein [Candidatus Limnocylindrales bacterium]